MELGKAVEIKAAKRCLCCICGTKGIGRGEYALNLKIRGGRWLVEKFPTVKLDANGQPIGLPVLGVMEPVCFACLHSIGEEI